MSDNTHNHIEAALEVIISLGLPRAQQNERSALALLALLNLTPSKSWAEAENPLMGITPMMDWAHKHLSRQVGEQNWLCVGQVWGSGYKCSTNGRFNSVNVESDCI